MTYKEIMTKFSSLLETVKVGILSTVDENGNPHMRWMTPTLMPQYPNHIYAVTSPHFGKLRQLIKHPEVQWMFQSVLLNEIFLINGRASLLDNPSLKSEVLEHIQQNLQVFWKLNPNPADLVVIETSIWTIQFFESMRQIRETVDLRKIVLDSKISKNGNTMNAGKTSEI